MKISVYFVYTGNVIRLVAFIGKICPQISFLTDFRPTDREGYNINSETKDLHGDATFGGVVAARAQFNISPDLFFLTIARSDYDFTNAEDDTHPAIPPEETKLITSQQDRK